MWTAAEDPDAVTTRRAGPLGTSAFRRVPGGAPGRESLPAGSQVIGGGKHLHFVTDTGWYQLDVDDIPA
jgi:hypothetical protein